MFRLGHPASIPEGIFCQSVRHPGFLRHCISHSDGDLSALAPHLVSTDSRSRMVQQGNLRIDCAFVRELGFQVSGI
jgi:hypothetical protein